MAKEIYEVVLTGGPSGGKTTALAVLSERFTEMGYRVLTSSEIATKLYNAGVTDLPKLAADHNWLMEFERILLHDMRHARTTMRNLANIMPEDKVLILYDRAEMDIAAYLGEDYFNALLEEEGISLADARDSYNGVIHLVSAAIGAEEHYTTANNKARSEDLATARELDRKTLRAYLGHPGQKIIDNSTSFEGKLQRVVRAISHILGVPVPTEIERKYLLERAPDFTDPIFSQSRTVDIEQQYLLSTDGHEHRIRRRTQDGQSSYYYAIKERIGQDTRIERERLITAREYLDLQQRRDPRTTVVHKQRTCFVYDNQNFELDHVTHPGDIWLLEIELTEQNDRIALPPAFKAAKDVTADRRYDMARIARDGLPGQGDLGVA